MKRICSLAVVGILWFLVIPPPIMPPSKDANGNIRTDSNAPLTQWLVLNAYHSEAACGYVLSGMQPVDRCVASNNAAIMGNPMAAKAAANVDAPAPKPKKSGSN